MIVSKTIKIKINTNSQVSFYNKKDINCIIGDEIELDVLQLPYGSNIIINAKCQVCLNEKLISYRNYNIQTKNNAIFCCSCKCARYKINKTNLEKYGGVSPTQNKEIIEKRKETCLKKFGYITNLKTDDTKDKIKNTCLIKYGVDNPSKSEAIKEKKKKTAIKNFDVEYYTQTQEYKFRFIDTCLKKYGVNHHYHNDEIFKKVINSSFLTKMYEDLLYQGKYELDFLEKYYKKFIITKAPTINYSFDGKDKKYYPDFYLPEYNLIIEIKSEYFYNLEKLKNDSKMNASINKGFNFIFIIDKNYDTFNKIVSLE